MPGSRGADNLEILNAASLLAAPDHNLAPGMIAVARGRRLADESVYAKRHSDGNYPTHLAGTTVRVDGRVARIYYVSPSEVAFHLPEDASMGSNTIVVTNSDDFVTRGVCNLAPSSPGIFALNGEGTGAAIALDSEHTTQFMPPQSVKDATWHQRTSLFGTGFGLTGFELKREVVFVAEGKRYAAPLATVTAVENLPGLEQITLAIPQQLRGAGAITIYLETAGRPSNVVTIPIASAARDCIVINEVLYDPPDGLAGDANRDGQRHSSDDEFIELYNASSVDLSLAGWSISTKTLIGARETVVHKFPAHTELPQADALVVFGGGDLAITHPFFGGARVQKSSSGDLSLNNAAMTVVIRDATGALISEITYGRDQASAANQSVTRSPDATGPLFPHLSVGDKNHRFSPGRRSDGDFFAPRRGALSRVALISEKTEIYPGQNVSFIAEAYDQYDRPLPNTSFVITTSDPQVLNVISLETDIAGTSAAAIIRGLALGEAKLTITASENSLTLESATISLRVIAPPQRIRSVRAQPASLSVNRGSIKHLEVIALDDNEAPIEGAQLSFASSHPFIAEVDTAGRVKGVSPGAATVSVSAPDNYGGTVSAQVEVMVYFPISINEILADVPPDDPLTTQIEGDANLDGKRDSGDEFVELINYSPEPLDVSGLIVADAASDRYTFPAGTVLAPQQGVVLFGVGQLSAEAALLGGALVKAAGALGLNDAGDRVTLKLDAPDGMKVIESISFGEPGDAALAPKNESLLRHKAAEIGRGDDVFFPHSVVEGVANRLLSPGTRADGTPYSSPAVTRIALLPQVTAIDQGTQLGLTAAAYGIVQGQEVEIPHVGFVWDVEHAPPQILSPTVGSAVTLSAATHGSIAVRARAGSQEGRLDLIVNPVIAAVEIAPATINLSIGQGATLTARARDAAGVVVSHLKFDFFLENGAMQHAAFIESSTDDSVVLRAADVGSMRLFARFVNPSGGSIIEGVAAITIAPAPTVHAPQPGELVINEALTAFATSTAQVRQDFVELLNKTDRFLDISGLDVTFRPAGAGASASNFQLPETWAAKRLFCRRARILIANGAQTYGAMADYDASARGFDLNNTSGGIRLY
ncbi:MAG: lamin tail domain-containing protein [Pyrinomonadaceae bacterium]